MSLNNRLKAIIIEDERTSREYLTNLIMEHFPAIDIMASEHTVQPAINAIHKYAPDLVFVDVEIKMGTGFDVLRQVDTSAFKVLFTTAFNQFAIDAFQYNAVDYLLKPLESEKVIQAISRCIRAIEQQKSNEEIIRLLQYLTRPVQQRLPVRTMHGLEFIDAGELLYAEAEGNYCKLKLKSGKSVTITKKIKDLAEQLPEPLFVRIHYSYLVNTSYIKKYHKGRGGCIILDDGSSLPVSPSRRDDFLQLFNQKL